MESFLLLFLWVVTFVRANDVVVPSRSSHRRRKNANGIFRPIPRRLLLRRSDDDTSPVAFLASTRSRSEELVMESDDVLDRDALPEDSSSVGHGFWPPWPFSLLTRSPETRNGSGHRSASAASAFWTFSKTSARVGIKNAQEVGSRLWFHMPPAAPPLILLSLIPRKHKIVTAAATEGAAAAEVVYKTSLPLLSNPFVRNLVLAGSGVAILSWAHSESQRKRKLTMLPLAEQYRDINRAVLPPFLPEEVPMAFLQAVQDQEDKDLLLLETDKSASGSGGGEGIEEEAENEAAAEDALVPPKLKRHWKQFRANAQKPNIWRASLLEWRKDREERRMVRKNAYRLSIQDELVALQTLKKKAARKRSKQQSRFGYYYSRKYDDKPKSDLGYALVTGASKGIGRAIAVELARWEIPLILVARDTEMLMALANDLEACYGVDCCVLTADLSKPNAAQKIYDTIQDAGLKVDILVNNAGISSQGLSLELPLKNVERMIQVNTVSVTTLTHLFGRDMKSRRRGRILMVSSICGAVSGIATVAVYSATKAFENSFGVALGKELEPYGVGVTCLMPGAVRGTEFRERSNSAYALCWKLPFYTKTAPEVAEWGVKAMLRGETEVTPGVMNRIFLKVLKPVMPQRLHNLVAEVMWNPLGLPPQLSRLFHGISASGNETDVVQQPLPVPPPHRARPRTYNYNTPPPRLLELIEQDPVSLENQQAPDHYEQGRSFEIDTEPRNGELGATSKEAREFPQALQEGSLYKPGSSAHSKNGTHVPGTETTQNSRPPRESPGPARDSAGTRSTAASPHNELSHKPSDEAPRREASENSGIGIRTGAYREELAHPSKARQPVLGETGDDADRYDGRDKHDLKHQSEYHQQLRGNAQDISGMTYGSDTQDEKFTDKTEAIGHSAEKAREREYLQGITDYEEPEFADNSKGHEQFLEKARERKETYLKEIPDYLDSDFTDKPKSQFEKPQQGTDGIVTDSEEPVINTDNLKSLESSVEEARDRADGRFSEGNFGHEYPEFRDKTEGGFEHNIPEKTDETHTDIQGTELADKPKSRDKSLEDSRDRHDRTKLPSKPKGREGAFENARDKTDKKAKTSTQDSEEKSKPENQKGFVNRLADDLHTGAERAKNFLRPHKDNEDSAEETVDSCNKQAPKRPTTRKGTDSKTQSDAEDAETRDRPEEQKGFMNRLSGELSYGAERARTFFSSKKKAEDESAEEASDNVNKQAHHKTNARKGAGAKSQTSAQDGDSEGDSEEQKGFVDRLTGELSSSAQRAKTFFESKKVSKESHEQTSDRHNKQATSERPKEKVGGVSKRMKSSQRQQKEGAASKSEDDVKKDEKRLKHKKPDNDMSELEMLLKQSQMDDRFPPVPDQLFAR